MEGITLWRTPRGEAVSSPEPAVLPVAFEACGPAVSRGPVAPSQGAGPHDFEPSRAAPAAPQFDARRVWIDDGGADGFAVAGLRPR